jgi:fibro-slime domain-containing protein
MISRMPSPVTALPALCLFLALEALGPSAAWSQTAPQSLVLTAKVRDFKESNPTDSVGTHPHFNNRNGCSAQELGVNTVQENLQTDGTADPAFPGDNRNPKLLDPLPAAIAACYDPPDRFADWFTDKSPDVNRPFLVDLQFDRDASTGMYVYQSNAFFPIDDGKPFRKIHADDPGTFGHLQKDSLDGKDLSQHNYGFTLELHTEVAYHEGGNQLLRFQGDDDIWVYLNGKRVIDLGGVHQTQKDSVDLDAAKAALGLEDGKTYPLDFFFAERHVASSTVLITTNMAMATPIRRPAAYQSALPAGPVAIYDRMGRLVATLPRDAAWASAGAPVPAWDRRDAAGNAAAPGVYLWRASGAKGLGGALVVR